MDTINIKFCYCINTEDLNAALELLASGADIHFRDDYALRWSAYVGNLDMVTKLLEHGASTNINEALGFRSALELSIGRPNININIMTKLLEWGADINFNDGVALRFACKGKYFTAIGKLLEYGANIYCNNRVILKNLQNGFNERMADIILPYCCVDDWEYFPIDYIRKRIMPVKSANATSIVVARCNV